MTPTELLDFVSQIAVAVFGVSSILLVAKKNKWGFILGLLAQPFWFATAILHNQPGVFLVAIAYTLSWAYGVYEWWFKDKKVNHKEIDNAPEESRD